MQKINEKKKLNIEIEHLKKRLEQKVHKYKTFSHPEVMLVSKMLDQKINELMIFINSPKDGGEKNSYEK